MRKVSKAGFSVLELIVVLCILAIIFAIAIPLFPVIEQHMKVRIDRTSAGNIANAVKAWYTDYSTDTTLKNSRDFLDNVEELTKEGRKSISLSSLIGIEHYVSASSFRSSSLLDENKVPVVNQYFFVSFIKNGQWMKIVITVGTEGVPISDTSVTNYDGSANGIIYIGN